ncbi:MAG: amino acid ABC transporter ATP-binding protein, partial [Erysipelothrix sp.]|nr:amino acid ABC transporter ATP-binding protein [Erysipelothrix sp.]
MLKITNAYKHFKDVDAIKDVSLTIEQHDVITLIGPSGSGKSTLLRLINGLEILDSGSITYQDQVIDYNDEAKLGLIRQEIGFVFQNFNLFNNLNVLDNLILAPMQLLNMPKDEAIALAKDYLNQVGLVDKLEADVKTLSGGQKQRVAIVRSLMMSPKILL